jgi:Flp pilus assembly pilin Flp
MKEMLMYLRMKLQEEKGEVSVEWALIASIMAIVIAAVFYPGVQTALNAAITTITNKINNP